MAKTLSVTLSHSVSGTDCVRCGLTEQSIPRCVAGKIWQEIHISDKFGLENPDKKATLTRQRDAKRLCDSRASCGLVFSKRLRGALCLNHTPDRVARPSVLARITREQSSQRVSLCVFVSLRVLAASPDTVMRCFGAFHCHMC